MLAGIRFQSGIVSYLRDLSPVIRNGLIFGGVFGAFAGLIAGAAVAMKIKKQSLPAATPDSFEEEDSEYSSMNEVEFDFKKYSSSY